MKDYVAANIRNIAVLGHGSEGKTTLVEALLYLTGVTDRQGRVEDGTTVTDFDPEETKRHISISAAIAPVEYKDVKINLIDVPGYFDFEGETAGALSAADACVIVVGALSGAPVGAEKAWAACEKRPAFQPAPFRFFLHTNISIIHETRPLVNISIKILIQK